MTLQMNRLNRFALLVSCLLGLSQTVVYAQDENHRGPHAAERTYAQNFKDMVFANCLAEAYDDDKQTVRNLASSHAALIDWTYFDMDKAPEVVADLVQRYLSLDYTNPFAEHEAPGLRFDFLKCLDLYHSDELEELTHEMVPEPESSIR